MRSAPFEHAGQLAAPETDVEATLLDLVQAVTYSTECERESAAVPQNLPTQGRIRVADRSPLGTP